ncbi:MAG: cytochrome c [candidate division FCPU426 bacterium]
MFKGILFGMILTLALGSYLVYVGIDRGWMPANADDKPPAWEKWAARKSLHATLAKEAPKEANSLAATEVNLLAGIKLYKADCAVCHGASDGAPSHIATGLYQRAPQFARHGVEDDPDGEIYWKIKHGIRLTGMPSFGKSLSEEQLWQLTLLLKHLDALPPAAAKVWRTVPSAKVSL